MYNSTDRPNPTQWDEFVNRHPQGHFLQTAAWGEIKSAFGWEAQQVALSNQRGEFVAGVQILYRELPLGAGKLAYVPFGPVVDWNDKALVRDVFLMMDKTAKRHGAVFLKLEPGYSIDTAFLRELKCRPSPQTVQPPRTVVLDIYGKDEEGNRLSGDFILKRMNQMTRRNIRKSEKSGISIREGTREDVAKFYALLETTSERQDFGVHVAAYYEKVYDCIITASKPPQGVLLLASYTDETTGQTHDLAGVFVFALGKQAWYVYGASNNIERQRMASFGVQWAAIEWARQHGAHTYDLYGIPDEDEATLETLFETRSDDPRGVYRFKRGWGGQVVRTVGTWDRVYNPIVYGAYRTYLFLRNRDGE